MWAKVRELLYPRVCASCEELAGQSFPFCKACAESLRALRKPICSHCGIPLPGAVREEVTCGACIRRPPAFDRARAAFVYNQLDRASALARAIARMKYGRRVALSNALAELLGYGCPLDPFAYDWVTPVPLALDRLRWRGFNQALLLARSLVPSERVAATLLRRTRGTIPQAELGRSQRLANVRGAFQVRDAWLTLVRDASILLVDDVMTTGATANECSIALKQAGARTVDVLVLARVILS